jgi:hypothetical protein
MTVGRLFAALSIAVFLCSCNKSPFDRSRDASGGGATGSLSPSVNLVVFSSELKTGGGAFLYPGGNNQTLSFQDTSNPISTRSIRYNWNGTPVVGGTLFAGFDLMNTPTLSTYNPNTGRNLSGAGYGKVTFYARGGLSTNTVLKVEAANPSNNGQCVVLSMNGTDDIVNIADQCNSQPTPSGCSKAQLSANWQSYRLTIVNSSNVADLFKATFIYNQPCFSTTYGQGGTVFFDQIQYQP